MKVPFGSEEIDLEPDFIPGIDEVGAERKYFAPKFSANKGFKLSDSDKVAARDLFRFGYTWGYDTDEETGIEHIALVYQGETVAWLEQDSNAPRYVTDDERRYALAGHWIAHLRWSQKATRWCRREEARGASVVWLRAQRSVRSTRRSPVRSRARRRHRRTRRCAASSGGSSDGSSDPPGHHEVLRGAA